MAISLAQSASVAPAAMSALLGKSGAILLLIVLFLAVTSAVRISARCSLHDQNLVFAGLRRARRGIVYHHVRRIQALLQPPRHRQTDFVGLTSRRHRLRYLHGHSGRHFS